ncbi:MAG: carbamate kinase [Candidatus Cloacimonadota bacterium]|nr:carbamate kinase [Candidatus Cloacimonadota bacterium]
MNKKAVIALGGNAIIKAGQDGNIHQQFANTRESLSAIVELLKQGYKLAITHGNGPQVGNLLIQQLAGIEQHISPLPLGVLNAATEGTMGYMIEQSLQNSLRAAKMEKDVVTIISQVRVDKEDPSIKEPSKPVGPFFDKEHADFFSKQYGWKMIEDSGRGYRQVVASPKPLDIVPAETIKNLVEANKVVIACGGGGIPFYIDDNGNYEGFDAVIDKDYASALLAREIEADLLVILTGVDKVAINFGTTQQTDLNKLNITDAKKYLADGQFPKGSMGPKISAAIDFIEKGGKEVLITSIDKVVDAFAGKTGTRICK